MSQPRILAFAGSTRTGSYNNRLLQIAATGAEDAGAQVTRLNLKDYPLPLFDQDLEQVHWPPENATRLKQLFLDHDGLLIASPEYNSSLTPLLKNTIDWVSRAGEGEAPLAAYDGKAAAIMAASPGGLGGLRGLVHLRSILSNIGVLVLPDQLAVSRASDAFDDQGRLKDDRQHARAEGLGAALVRLAGRLGD